MDFEQDYIMRMIKQMVKALISFVLGKENPLVELPLEEQYRSSEGFKRELLDMVNDGLINEAENLLYEKIDYSHKESVSDAVAFYGYLNELDNDFLEQHNYTREEVAEGLKNIASRTGVESIVDAFM